MRFARQAVVVSGFLALLVLVAPLADARGGGGGFSGGKRGGGARRAARASVQGMTLIADCVRADNVRRMRERGW